MWIRSLPESSASTAAITIEEAFNYCRKFPVVGVDLERFLGIFVSGPHSIVDARDVGALGLIMDRLIIADGAKPFEWIGAEIDAVDAAIFPTVLARVRRVARDLRVPAIDMTLSNQWSKVRDLLSQAGAAPQFVDLEMTHADCAWGFDRAMPKGWHWSPASPNHERAYVTLLERNMGSMPGVYLPPKPEAIASMRTTADGTRLLMDANGAARALIRCKPAKRYLHLVACAPDMRGRGLGRMALDEVRRMLGPGPLHLTVVKQNKHAHGFYLHMGFVETEQVETWRLPIAS
jgi:hypothetical protein